MSADILNLDPKPVWNCFHQLTQIPRPSKHEEAIQQFMLDFAAKLKLKAIKDEAGNIIIRKPATPGMENRQGVILQGHLDMVPQKNSDTIHDFTKDPIETLIDGNWVTANDTTLGADNGIGVAAAMAVLEARDIKHGPIECLFTTDEETGLSGAFALKYGILEGDILMNLDSEEEGELFIGCAGGIDVVGIFEFNTEPVPIGFESLKLSLTGLKGGHSGTDINLGRGNANKLMNRLLMKLINAFNIRIASISGGNLRNAIPRESFVEIVVPAEDVENVLVMVTDYKHIFSSELVSVEPFLKLEAERIDLPEEVIDFHSQSKLVHAVSACVNGVIRMSDDMPGLVETSSNLACVKSGEHLLEIACLVRSSVDSAMRNVAQSLESVFKLAEASVDISSGYPGWKPNVNSPILNLMRTIYQNKFGAEPKVTAIHAGLECGLLGATYPNLDIISFGPTIRFPHSPDEKVNIASVGKFWDFLVEALQQIPEK